MKPEETPRTPDQIKISLSVKGDDKKEKEVSFHVVPCSGESVEEFLALTWSQWCKNITAKLPEKLRKDGPTLFRFFPQCLGVTATTMWAKVLEEQNIENIGENELDNEKFLTCVSLFMEEIAGVTYLGDAIIRFICHGKKPGLMAPDACFRRRATLMAYFESGLLRSKLAKPTAYQLAEAVFLQMPRAHQERYAETNKEVTADTTALRSAMMQYHATDERNGVLARLKGDRGRKRPADDDKSGRNRKSRRTGRRSPKRHGRRGRDRRDRTDRRDEGRDRRYRDADRDRHRDYRGGNNFRNGGGDRQRPDYKGGKG
ncbi:MAG TPA: hypothetical protein VLS45_00455, partial [Methylomicrobium sp.]|nr:hypothetical protein [Methylomicrobium sp.]